MKHRPTCLNPKLLHLLLQVDYTIYPEMVVLMSIGPSESGSRSAFPCRVLNICGLPIIAAIDLEKPSFSWQRLERH